MLLADISARFLVEVSRGTHFVTGERGAWMRAVCTEEFVTFFEGHVPTPKP